MWQHPFAVKGGKYKFKTERAKRFDSFIIQYKGKKKQKTQPRYFFYLFATRALGEV